jgi:hydroxyacylglutathione hydrolase
MRIRYVIDTHLHADHISAGRELAKAAGAEYFLFAEANAAFPFRGVHNGEVLELGNVSIHVLHTPGHAPEHISLLVTDRTRSDEPWFVLTDHTLMVGDLGQTELATSAEEHAPGLRNVTTRRYGSMTKRPSCAPWSRMCRQRRCRQPRPVRSIPA